ncbi:hypothetical protein NGM33_28865 [Nocardiopsis dassonvillei]|uniref:hypothetical protein n=1 Tax=Nocardiopsis dassonvillei TaxID=2014 RepID=UPI0020A27ABB|nr:hypothetical protein [Nocardiopsis dassonvillei]MCP3017350.1 hypothetical protein [Nocardiopsis dassonvillei]
MTKSRWGGSSGPTTAPGGRMRRAARAARDWADKKTGQKASSAFKAARKEKGFRARSKAASRAVRKKGSGKITSGIVGVIVAAFTGLASLFGWLKPDAKKAPKKAVKKTAKTTAKATGPDTKRGGKAPRAGGHAVDPGQEKSAPPTGPDASTTTTSTPAAHATGGTTMAGSRSLPHAQHAADMLAGVTRYEPEDLFVVIDQARQWPDMVRDTAMAVRTYVQVLQANRFPLQNGSIDALQDLFNALIKVMPAAEAIHPQMCRDHAPDLERANYGRGDERRANVS